MLDNSLEGVLLWFAANRLGAIAAPVNTAFKESYLQAQLADCGAQIAVFDAEYVHRLEAIRRQLPELSTVFVRDANVGGTGVAALLSDRTDRVEEEVKPEDTSILVYTSGTTGPAKGCMIPHDRVCGAGWTTGYRLNLTGDDVMWTALPLFHLNAIGITVGSALMAQARAAISSRFSVSGFWPEIERSGATMIGLLGSMAALLANAPETEAERRCFRQINHIVVAPYPKEIAEVWRKRFGVYSHPPMYGMTEAAPITSTLPGDPAVPPGSSGRIGVDFDVRIVDDNSDEVPAGAVGEIICRPLHNGVFFNGYWGRPADTVKAWRDLWFHTGDMARVDENGYLFFADRKKDYIRRRGENISTLQMEEVFLAHPAIADIAVHAVASPLGEDDVKITVQLSSPGVVSHEELCRWAIDRLPYFAVPLYIEFRETLPRGPTGKVLKDQLRADGRTPNTWCRDDSGVTFARR
jgi:crotonobetaine/carnitine-CoA ligase